MPISHVSEWREGRTLRRVGELKEVEEGRDDSLRDGGDVCDDGMFCT